MVAWSLPGVVALAGVALAVEPIFVTPPVEEKAVPIFVAPSTKKAMVREPASQVPETPPARLKSPEPVSAPRSESVKKKPSEVLSEPAEQAAPMKDSGMEREETGKPVVDIRLGPKSRLFDIKAGLPPEIGILQAALAKTADNIELLPEREAPHALCRDAEKIGDLTSELGRTPLMEVTTHFTLWREAMKKLSRSVADYRRQCVEPSAASVKAFRRVLDDFDALLKTR